MIPKPENVVRAPSLSKVPWPSHAVFVVDQRVAELHPELPEPVVTVRAGEELKTLEAVGRLAERVLAERSTRPMTIVAVGGGSLTDAVGFLASILWRGVDLWNVPTTVLGAADSAFGGKTAVNLGKRKNQLGTFWAARAVVLVDDVLSTLPRPLRADGMAEVVKSIWLAGEDDLPLLDAGVDRLAYGAWDVVGDDVMRGIEASIALKRDIVRRDPRETKGIRTFLNLGHTLAHAIELTDGFSHGRAVSWGLASVAHLCVQRGELSPDDGGRLWRHVRPLLGTRPPSIDLGTLESLLVADKKRVADRLRSVVLRGPGEPEVTDEVDAPAWQAALAAASQRLRQPMAISMEKPASAKIVPSAGKSAMNRLLAIASIRPGSTTVVGSSDALDVVTMRRGLEALRDGQTIYAGAGGTTFRFLLALAALRPDTRRIRLDPQLAARPHEPLYEALRGAGAAVEVDGDDVLVGTLPGGPLQFLVDASRSSQFASALALLAASGREVSVRIQGEVASPGYLEMTLRCLEEAGIEVTSGGGLVRLVPTEALTLPATLVAHPDASSRAVWIAARWLGLEDLELPEADPLQPDAVVDALLWDPDSTEMVVIDLADAPDLAPVLAAAAASSPAAVRITGAPHLRDKESNRIDDLAESFAGVGITVHPLDDGLLVPAGIQVATAGSTFVTKGDHRLAMAACLLALEAELVVDDPTVVAKSYPEFWEDAARAGFRLSDRSGPFPDI